MADNKAGGASTPTPAQLQQEYKKEQTRLRDMIEKQRQLSKKLATVEDTISQKEVSYLEACAAGNIITGYDNYVKGVSSAAAQRRKMTTQEQSRVFSKSSISYRPINSEATTPGSISSTPASHAPTPLSTSFKDSLHTSSHPTPTSGTAGKVGKKKRQDEDSEPESAFPGIKKRMTFGAGRK